MSPNGDQIAAPGREALERLADTELAMSPFQHPRWIHAFLAGFGEARFRLLDLVIGDTCLLLPVMIRQSGFFALADIVGGKHASFHAPAFSGGPVSREVLQTALVAAARKHGIDAFTFTDCPVRIDDAPNPLAILDHQSSPSFSAELAMEGPPEALLQRLLDRDDRKKLRQKERKLAEALGPVRAGFASDERDIAAALDALARWKSLRFGAKGIDDPFAGADAQRFLKAATAGNAPPVRIFTLHAGDQLVALMAGAVSASRFSGMANANDPDPAILKSSPGDLLIQHLVGALASEGKRFFDLGVGEARYKARWCPDELPLFDCAVAASAKGRAAGAMFLATRRMKRMIKQSSAGMALINRMRMMKATISRDRS